MVGTDVGGKQPEGDQASINFYKQTLYETHATHAEYYDKLTRYYRENKELLPPQSYRSFTARWSPPFFPFGGSASEQLLIVMRWRWLIILSKK